MGNTCCTSRNPSGSDKGVKTKEEADKENASPAKPPAGDHKQENPALKAKQSPEKKETLTQKLKREMAEKEAGKALQEAEKEQASAAPTTEGSRGAEEDLAAEIQRAQAKAKEEEEADVNSEIERLRKRAEDEEKQRAEGDEKRAAEVKEQHERQRALGAAAAEQSEREAEEQSKREAEERRAKEEEKHEASHSAPTTISPEQVIISTNIADAADENRMLQAEPFVPATPPAWGGAPGPLARKFKEQSPQTVPGGFPEAAASPSAAPGTSASPDQDEKKADAGAGGGNKKKRHHYKKGKKPAI